MKYTIVPHKKPKKRDSDEGNRRNLKDFSIKDGVLEKYLGNDVEVRVPDGVKRIGKEAFTQKIIYDSRLEPPEGHFYGEGLTREEDYRWAAAKQVNIPIKGKGSQFLKTVVIPEGVAVIDDCAFCFCRNLERVVMPRSLRRIGQHAFHGCGSLKSVEIPKNAGVDTGAFDSGCEVRRV